MLRERRRKIHNRWGTSGRGGDISSGAEHCGKNTGSSAECRKEGQYNREKSIHEAWTGTRHDYLYKSTSPIPEQANKVYFLGSDAE